MRSIALSQAGQRSTTPGALVNASSVPISPSLPHAAHSVGSAVISRANTSYSRPATELPSVISDRFTSSGIVPMSWLLSSGSGWPKSLGTDLRRGNAKLEQGISHQLDENGWPAHVGSQRLSQRPADVAEHGAVDPPLIAGPARGLLPREGMDHLQAVVVGLQPLELAGVDHVV